MGSAGSPRRLGHGRPGTRELGLWALLAGWDQGRDGWPSYQVLISAMESSVQFGEVWPLVPFPLTGRGLEHT